MAAVPLLRAFSNKGEHFDEFRLQASELDERPPLMQVHHNVMSAGRHGGLLGYFATEFQALRTGRLKVIAIEAYVMYSAASALQPFIVNGWPPVVLTKNLDFQPIPNRERRRAVEPFSVTAIMHVGQRYVLEVEEGSDTHDLSPISQRVIEILRNERELADGTKLSGKRV